jgi:SAM-dependent methyltransferase
MNEVRSPSWLGLQRLSRPFRRVTSALGGRLRPSVNRAEQRGLLIFQCNVCSGQNKLPLLALEREAGACGCCGSTMRYRAAIHCLSTRLFGQSLTIDDFPPEARTVNGLGMSDPEPVASRLRKGMGYINTFFHREPRLDIQAPSSDFVGSCDYVLSSDVFEHVAPPLSGAFANLRTLLRPGGVLALTVPFVLEGDTVEHFPDLYDYSIEQREAGPILVNRTKSGLREEHSNLMFHGGPGETLEMRVFSRSGLERELVGASFSNVRFHQEACFDFGIYWANPWSVPVTAIAA